MGAQFKTGGFAATSYREFDADPVGANERLWVGNMEACEKFEGARICVTETPCRYVDSGCIQIPILTRRGLSAADHEALDRVAAKVDELLRTTNGNILIHCWVGMERSPLAATWTLSKLEQKTMTEAFAQVKATRKIAENRFRWLEQQELYDWTAPQKTYVYQAPKVSSVYRLTPEGLRFLSRGGRYYRRHPEIEKVRKEVTRLKAKAARAQSEVDLAKRDLTILRRLAERNLTMTENNLELFLEDEDL